MRSTGNPQKTTAGALEELGAELGISEVDFGGEVKIDGKDPVVASRHHLGESTSVLLALFGMELAAIWKQRTGKCQDVKVNVRNAVCNLAATFYAKHNGVTIPFDDVGLEQTTDFFRCKDGRWVYIVCSLPHLRQRACAVLGCQATRDSFVDRCMRWNGALLEEAMNAVGASCAMVRTREEWLASEQGKITMAEPLMSIQKIGDSDPTGFSANEGSPTARRTRQPTCSTTSWQASRGCIGMFEALRRRAREGGSYLVRATLAGNCSWLQDFGMFPAHEVHGVGLPESLMAAPGLNARLRPEFELPLVTATGPLGEMSVLPPQVELSEFELGPRFSGDPNGASKLDWSVFTKASKWQG